MKTYYLTLSTVFPSTHQRKGEETGFYKKLARARDCSRCELSGWAGDVKLTDYLKCTNPCYDGYLKLHTIRANYDFWRKRFDKIATGEACLSIRQWVGKPYGKGSTQRELARLTREDGIGIQKLELELADKLFGIYHPRIDDGKGVSSIEELANNDGLSLNDWRKWFKDYDLSKPMAIIHFTPFRY